MEYSHETKIDAVCAEIFVLSTCVAYLVYFFRALNQKCLSQATKCGITVARGLKLYFT